jgi:hypothetical protein
MGSSAYATDPYEGHVHTPSPSTPKGRDTGQIPTPKADPSGGQIPVATETHVEPNCVVSDGQASGTLVKLQCANCGHSRRTIVWDLEDVRDSLEDTPCAACGEKGFMCMKVLQPIPCQELDRRNMAKVKHGSELFSGESGPFRSIPSKPIPHETVRGSSEPKYWDGPLDDYEEEASTIDWHALKRESAEQYRNDPERREYWQHRNQAPPSEPDDRDPADYAFLGYHEAAE